MTKCTYLSRPYRLTILFSLVFLSACSPQSVTPACPYQNKIEPEGNAGCLVVHQDQLMVVKRRFGDDLDLPGGTSDQGETARCTAFRETFEETGHIVQVGKWLATLGDGYRLYHCTTATPKMPLTVHDTIEIREAFWRRTEQLSPDEWRFPEQMEQIKQLVKEFSQN